MRFVCIFNIQLIDEVIAEFYVRLALGSLTTMAGMFFGILQFFSGEVTIRSVYTIVTGKVKGNNFSVSAKCWDPLNLGTFWGDQF